MPDEKKETQEKKEEPPKSKEEVVRDKRIRRNLCCCGLILGVLFFVGLFSNFGIFSLFGGAGSLPTPIPVNSKTVRPSSVPTSTNTASANYPEPKACSQVSTPDAASMSLNTTNPGLKKDVDVIYYPIYGYTFNQLMDQIRTCGIKDEGTSFAGRTNWRVNWTYDYDTSGQGCALKNVTVGVKIDIYYPKWQQPDDFASGLDTKWEQWMASLEEHENIHKQYGLDGALDIQNQLAAYGGASDCSTTKSEADGIAYQILDKLNADNKAFDDRTNHGANPENN